MVARTTPSILIVCTMMLLSSCSDTPADLLREGDSAVCALENVTNQVFDNLKQRGSIFEGRDLLPNYDQVLHRALQNVSLNAEQVISFDVDKENRRAACNAYVAFSANGIESRSANVSYTLTANLADEDPVVMVNVSAAVPVLNTILTKMTASLVQEARENRTAENERRADIYEESWSRVNVTEAAEIKANVLSDVSPNRFAAWEIGMIVRERLVARQCDTTGGEEAKLMCDRSRGLESS